MRSGAEALLVGRGGLDTVLAFTGAFALVGFLASAAAAVVAGLGAAGLGLGRLAAPGTAAAPALALAAFPVALFGRLKSAAIVIVGKGKKARQSPTDVPGLLNKHSAERGGIDGGGNGARLPEGDFAVVFLASAGFASVLIAAQHKAQVRDSLRRGSPAQTPVLTPVRRLRGNTRPRFSSEHENALVLSSKRIESPFNDTTHLGYGLLFFFFFLKITF